jgi:NAD(P)-dependent dehydrogenase (short-subunit alcohol dehydrogenase family)
VNKFSGRVAAITGAGSGIGQALAVQLAERGCTVALSDKNTEGLASTREKIEAINGICSVQELDVADREAVEAWARTVVATHGGVHMLFNNAGVTLIDSVETMAYEDFEWLMNINFWGVVYGTKAFLPYLKQSDEAHIVNISSLFGLYSLPLQSAYNSAKFAVRGFTESLKMELAGTSVDVSCVHPGGIKTEIANNARVREDNIGVAKKHFTSIFDNAAKTTAQEAASAIIKGVEKNRRRILVGWDAKFSDIVVRLFPGSYEKRLKLEQG